MCGHGGSGGETKRVQGGEPNASHIQLPLCFSQRLQEKRLKVVYLQSVVGCND